MQKPTVSYQDSANMIEYLCADVDHIIQLRISKTFVGDMRANLDFLVSVGML